MLVIYKDGEERIFKTPGQDAVGFRPEGWIEPDPTIYKTAEEARESTKTKPGPKYWTREDGVVCMGLFFDPNYIINLEHNKAEENDRQ